MGAIRVSQIGHLTYVTPPDDPAQCRMFRLGGEHDPAATVGPQEALRRRRLAQGAGSAHHPVRFRGARRGVR
jgi:hypothetical protein